MDRRKLDWQRKPPLVEPEADLPDFSDTIASQLEDSTREMRILKDPRRRQTVEYQNLQNQVIGQLTDELREQREVLAKVVEYTKGRASKAKLEVFARELTEKIDKRLDNIRNLVIALVMAGFAALGLLGVFKH